MSRPNTLGMVGQGHRIAGERNGRAKLSTIEVRVFRWCRRVYGATYEAMAKPAKVDPSVVGKACRRKTWRRA